MAFWPAAGWGSSELCAAIPGIGAVMIRCLDWAEGDYLLVKNRNTMLFIVLVLAALVLSGCGVPHEGVDVMNTPPNGFWQTIAVWPLAKALVWLSDLLQSAKIPYHWGFAIIAFTLFVKVITFPLSLSQIRGMQAQKELQPKIQELQKKYGKDREKIAQEQMKLYQEAGVNPLSGCLPLLIQMPVLFALYAALVALGPSFDNAAFFWLPDLGFPKYTEGLGWITKSFNTGDYGTLAAYLVLPILLVGTQFIMQKQMTATTPSADNSQAQMMQQVSLMMTFMFGFFTLTVPAGLTLYWVTSNLLAMLQQWLITSGPFKIISVTAAASGAKPATSNTAKSADVPSNGASASEAAGERNTVTKTREPAVQPVRRRKPSKAKGK
jgi:YidC/Oxa1 family membrane protein insertase